MEFSSVLAKRRSVRGYLRDSVPPDTIDEIVDLARRAPTAGFSQGIDFVVVDEPGLVGEFWEMTTDPAHADVYDHDAAPPVVVIVLSDPERYLSRYRQPDKVEFGKTQADDWPVRFWDVDGGMASMVVLLAAIDKGLAGWFFGIAHGEEAVRTRLRIPPDRNMVGVIGLGYADPAEVKIGSATTRKRRPLSEQLHRNGW
jgi:nitroreductase